ncbi:H/ACA ribonucleoprotein complex subunit GAR1 [Candidatus Acidianus copahuensis]|uniref:H/ACA RNA-protein complex protein Gar1 n=1 Tax=Candidatus Acidianus copahuensis TaxID=1160895 RepID=A0A031LMD5_9CREN|nr:Gar1/Naf1 family protein [Candidatus Acidianus copahuensis]EZQ06803.1 H/ACA RNA-protein complex protein Gar1 [Candidatus Acidianus copahuensis]NON61814.1 H/ACA RNA-protein complex protein Gar1 [Acidianus sp. RZ1]
MTKINTFYLGTFYKQVLEDKWLIKASRDVDYTRHDPIGRIVLDSKGNRVGKVIDVIGNVQNPYALVIPITPSPPKGELYVEFPQRSKKVRRDRR